MIANGDASQGELLGACVEGLTTLRYYYPFFDSFDPKAYQMTLAYLKKTPRSGNLPTWMVIGSLMKEPKAEWKTLAREFKAKDLVAALADIAKDPQANSRARDYALEAIAIHGGKAGLQALALCRSEERRVGKECRSRWSPYH